MIKAQRISSLSWKPCGIIVKFFSHIQQVASYKQFLHSFGRTLVPTLPANTSLPQLMHCFRRLASHERLYSLPVLANSTSCKSLSMSLRKVWVHFSYNCSKSWLCTRENSTYSL